VSHCGATPIFVDVDKDTYNLSVESLELAIKKVQAEGMLTPKVIVAVDLFGLPADFDKIREVAKKYGLLILEDAAQGFGGEINGKKACSFGDISTTSFFPAKPLGCYGDGGAVFTDDDELADLMRSICVHGKGTMKYDNVRIGLNSRLDTIQAAILSIKLKAFKEYEVADVNKVADRYTELLNGVVTIPVVPKGFYSSWAQYTIQLKDRKTRDAMQAALKEAGIPSMVYYPKPMHKQEAFGISGDYPFDCSNTKELCDTVLSLPMHPYLREKEIDLVVKTIKENLSSL
jgi:dTDP-4-amino-4,6-dideoxygalactose transaminase